MQFTDETMELEQDTVPQDLIGVEYACEVCGREAGPYGGRGRKPTRCPDHKKGAAASARKPSTGRNGQLAAQATEVLITTHGLVAFAATMVGYENTSDAIKIANEEFRSKAIEALTADPELARQILRGGPLPGRVALIMAYAMFGAAVVPTALVEHRVKQAKRAELKGLKDGDIDTGA